MQTLAAEHNHLFVMVQGPIVKYIGAFEPLVIRSLRQYTGTGDADLQRRILQLLIQLIRLRVNYSMLDAEQVGENNSHILCCKPD